MLARVPFNLHSLYEHAFALISRLKDMLNRFIVAVRSPLMRTLNNSPSSEDVRIQEKLVLQRHGEMLRIGLVPYNTAELSENMTDNNL